MAAPFAFDRLQRKRHLQPLIQLTMLAKQQQQEQKQNLCVYTLIVCVIRVIQCGAQWSFKLELLTNIAKLYQEI